MKIRYEFLEELKKVFDDADVGNKGEISRCEFEKLIQGYFELKGIRSTKENYDKYFKRLDANRDKTITFREFIGFADTVNEREIMPVLENELQCRGLL